MFKYQSCSRCLPNSQPSIPSLALATPSHPPLTEEELRPGTTGYLPLALQMWLQLNRMRNSKWSAWASAPGSPDLPDSPVQAFDLCAIWPCCKSGLAFEKKYIQIRDKQGSKFSLLLSRWKLPRNCLSFWTHEKRFHEERGLSLSQCVGALSFSRLRMIWMLNISHWLFPYRCLHLQLPSLSIPVRRGAGRQLWLNSPWLSSPQAPCGPTEAAFWAGSLLALPPKRKYL